jgi:cytochrome c-type biogenesis protein
VVFDETGFVFYYYGISTYPTTFMIDINGNVFGYIPGGLTRTIMDSIIDQTMRMERD